jgi:hypothetical protein
MSMLGFRVVFAVSLVTLTLSAGGSALAQTQTRPPIDPPGTMTSPYNSNWARPLPQSGPQIQQTNRGTQPPIEQPGTRQTTPRPQGGIISN